MDDSALIPSSFLHLIPGEMPIIYKRLEELGHGGFARVYRAVNRSTGKEYAVKVTSKERLKKPKAMKNCVKWLVRNLKQTQSNYLK